MTVPEEEPKDLRLWCDQYRPSTLVELTQHPELNERLKCIAKFPDFPNLLVQGPAGAGKMTRVYCLLREIFGNGIYKTNVCTRQVQATKSTKMEVDCLQSNYHVELSLNDVGFRDAAVCRDFVKEYCSSRAPSGHKFKIIVLKNADALSHAAQAAMRRLMELYVSHCRFIMVCETASHLIRPLQSRCLCIRVPAMPLKNIAGCLNLICQDAVEKYPEQFFPVSDDLCEKIAIDCKRDMYKSLIKLQTISMDKRKAEKGEVPILPWEKEIGDMCRAMIDRKNHNPRLLLNLRNHIYKLLGAAIPGEVILSAVTSEMGKIFPAFCFDALDLAAKYEPLMRNGQKPSFALDAFLVKMVAVLQQRYNASVQ